MKTIKTPEQILDETAKKIMLSWSIAGFKNSHPHLYSAVILAMKAYHSQFELSDKEIENIDFGYSYNSIHRMEGAKQYRDELKKMEK